MSFCRIITSFCLRFNPHLVTKGIGRKFSRGGREQRKKSQKLAKKNSENSTIYPLPGGEEQWKKRPKNSKKSRK